MEYTVMLAVLEDKASLCVSVCLSRKHSGLCWPTQTFAIANSFCCYPTYSLVQK